MPRASLGIISTDMHGTGRETGFVSASVVGLRVLDGRGDAHDVWVGDPLFSAAVGGIGAVGVITDREPLLADVADNLEARSGGRISPTGRYVLVQQTEGRGVTVSALANGIELELDNGCIDATTAQWSDGDALMACRADGGILVHELATGAASWIDDRGARSVSFAFVST